MKSRQVVLSLVVGVTLLFVGLVAYLAVLWKRKGASAGLKQDDHSIDLFSQSPLFFTTSTEEFTSNFATSAILDTCNNFGFNGDDFCDDGNNNAACDYDGGDCCKKNASYSFCTQCQCIKAGIFISQYQGNIAETCPLHGFVGDGQCDDLINTPNCSFDGGDCCTPFASYDYCKVCQCILSADMLSTPQYIEGQCHKTSWIGDGYCDDETNTKDCSYDGGDCCDPKATYINCMNCTCFSCEDGWEMLHFNCYMHQKRENSFFEALEGCQVRGAKLFEPKDAFEHSLVTKAFGVHFNASWIGISRYDTMMDWFVYQSDKSNLTFENWMQGEPSGIKGSTDCALMHNDQGSLFMWEDSFCASTNATSICQKPLHEKPFLPYNWDAFVGDGFCDDDLNHIDLSFDAGDCCLPVIDATFCMICFCIADGTRHPSFTTELCIMDFAVGDGVCDDETNNYVCDFDGGDCCLPSSNTQYCNICECFTN